MTITAAPAHNQMARNQMSPLDWAMLGLCAIAWGSAYTFNKIAISELPPLTITAARLPIAALFLFSLCLATRTILPPFGRAWAPFFVFTLLSNVTPFLFVLRGQRDTASGLAAVIGATTPLFVMLLAHVWTADEKLAPRKVVGVATGLAGVGIVMGPAAWTWTGDATAKFALIFASVLYAIGAIYSKRLVAYPPLTLATLQMTCGSLITVPLALLWDKPWSMATPSRAAVGAIAGTAIIGSSLAAITYFHVLRRAGATNAMLVTLLVPVTPILLGSILFGESLLPREIIGALIIALALLIIDGRLVQLWTRAAAQRKP
jgi:drug/metabolite transporter (DMT)-like permease